MQQHYGVMMWLNAPGYVVRQRGHGGEVCLPDVLMPCPWTVIRRWRIRQAIIAYAANTHSDWLVSDCRNYAQSDFCRLI